MRKQLGLSSVVCLSQCLLVTSKQNLCCCAGPALQRKEVAELPLVDDLQAEALLCLWPALQVKEFEKQLGVSFVCLL